MQRISPEQLAADIEKEIARLWNLTTDKTRLDELSAIEVYYAEDFSYYKLKGLLKELGEKNSVDVNCFVEYLRSCEAVINGVYADRQKRLAVKSPLQPVFRHKEETDRKRITDIDYPASPKTFLALANSMIAARLYQYMVINASDDDQPAYATPLDFLYSGTPSRYPHADELGLPFAAFVMTQSGRPLNVVACLDKYRNYFDLDKEVTPEMPISGDSFAQAPLLYSEEEIASLCAHSEEAKHYFEGIKQVEEGEKPEQRNQRLKTLRRALLNQIYSNPLGLNLNGFIMTECGRPLNVMVALDQFRQRFEVDRNAAIFTRHTSYAESEFQNGMPPRLMNAEHFMLVNHSEAARLYYEGILKCPQDESVDVRKIRLDQLQINLCKTIHDTNARPAYHVEMNAENFDLNQHITNNVSPKRLLQNGFMADLAVTDTVSLAKLMSMVNLFNLPLVVDGIDYDSLCDILLPKVKKPDGKFYPDLEMLDDKSRLKRYLERGEFWNATDDNRDRIIQVLFAKLLEHKEVRENKRHKQTALTEYIKFLCDYNDETRMPRYCMNQFPEYMRANHNDKTFAAPSSDGRVSVLIESGKNRHDVKIRVNEKKDDGQLTDEMIIAPEGYGQNDLLRDIKFIASKPRSEWSETLNQLFTQDRVTKLNAYLDNKKRKESVIDTRFSIFNQFVNRAVNGDPFIAECNHKAYYMSYVGSVDDDMAHDNNDAARVFFNRWYWHMRSNEDEKNRQAKLDASVKFEEMIISNHPTNNIFEYLKEIGREDLGANFQPGTTKVDRLTSSAEEAKNDREREKKACHSQAIVLGNVATVDANNAGSSWLPKLW